MGDAELEQLRRDYLFETDDELKRKREVFRSFIVSHDEEQAAIRAKAGDLDSNRRRYEVVSRIIRKRQRAAHRREMAKEIVIWAGLIAPFLAGVWTSELVTAAWSAVRASISAEDAAAPADGG